MRQQKCVSSNVNRIEIMQFLTMTDNFFRTDLENYTYEEYSGEYQYDQYYLGEDEIDPRFEGRG